MIISSLKKGMLLVPLLAYLILSYACSGNGIEHIGVTYDFMQLEGQLNDNKSFVVLVRLADFKKLKDDSQNENYWWIDKPHPSQIIETFSISVDGKQVPLSDSAYNDLADVYLPHGMDIYHVGDTALIQIRGGGGAGAFTAKFFVNDGLLKKRSVIFMNIEGEKDSVVTVY